MRRAAIPLAIGLILVCQPAHAVCSTASLEQDYAEADVVVRARVVAETVVVDDEPTPAVTARWGTYFPMSLHRVRVIEIFKGRPGPTINLLEEVSSGRYGVTLGNEYLLFFTYHRPSEDRGSVARGAMYVRHTCEQTRHWNEVSSTYRARLRSLARD